MIDLGILLAAGAVLLLTDQKSSHKSDIRADFEQVSIVWPISNDEIIKVGDSVRHDRRGVPHNGLDIYAKPGTDVVSASIGIVEFVIDGRIAHPDSPAGKAGLFVGVKSGPLYFVYMHLGTSAVKAGDNVSTSYPIGTTSAKGESGIRASEPHLHFEIRRGFDSKSRKFGKPIDPLRLLPKRG